MNLKKTSNFKKNLVRWLEISALCFLINVLAPVVYEELSGKPSRLAVESESIQIIDSINRGQALRVREGKSLAKDFEILANPTLLSNTNIDSESSEYYIYFFTTTEDRVLVQAIPKQTNIRGTYIRAALGGIMIFKNSDKELTIREIICKVDLAGEIISPRLINFEPEDLKSECPEGSKKIFR